MIDHYILDDCNECILNGECIIFEHILEINKLLKENKDNILNKLGYCKIKVAIEKNVNCFEIDRILKKKCLR